MAGDNAANTGLIAEKIRQARGWDSVMREVMLAGKHLDVLPVTRRHDDNKVAGCQSQVWLEYNATALQAWSDSKVIRGVLAILIECKRQHPSFNQEAYQAYLTELGLARYLSESRTSGIRFVIERLVSFK